MLCCILPFFDFAILSSARPNIVLIEVGTSRGFGYKMNFEISMMMQYAGMAEEWLKYRTIASAP